MDSSEAVKKIESEFKESILLKTSFRGELSLTVNKSDILSICSFCKETLSFDYLVDLTANDNMGSDPR